MSVSHALRGDTGRSRERGDLIVSTPPRSRHSTWWWPTSAASAEPGATRWEPPAEYASNATSNATTVAVCVNGTRCWLPSSPSGDVGFTVQAPRGSVPLCTPGSDCSNGTVPDVGAAHAGSVIGFVTAGACGRFARTLVPPSSPTYWLSRSTHAYALHAHRSGVCDVDCNGLHPRRGCDGGWRRGRHRRSGSRHVIAVWFVDGRRCEACAAQ